MNNACGSDLILTNWEPSPAAVTLFPGRFPSSFPGPLVRGPAGSALKAPCEMLMEQCAHSDGLRDKGTEDRPEHARDSLAPPCIPGQPAALWQKWEGVGWEKCVLCLTEGLCQAGREWERLIRKSEPQVACHGKEQASEWHWDGI